VKASLADDETDTSNMKRVGSNVPDIPRHRDINIGVLLMFVGSLGAIFVAGDRLQLGREGGALFLSGFLLTSLLLSKPIMRLIRKLLSWEDPSSTSLSSSVRGMGFGAALMYIGTILSAIIAFLMNGRVRTDNFFGALGIFLLISLVFSSHIMRALQFVVTGEATRPSKTAIPVNPSLFSDNNIVSGAALPPAQSIPVSLFDSKRATTEEMVMPPSVTERTTKLIDT
jgi:hypothetical protein